MSISPSLFMSAPGFAGQCALTLRSNDGAGVEYQSHGGGFQALRPAMIS
jgi:hypothetical protein